MKGHANFVNKAVFSANRIATASGDSTARIWRICDEMQMDDCLYVLRGHEDGLCSVEFNSDGDEVVTASLDKTARIWRIKE